MIACLHCDSDSDENLKNLLSEDLFYYNGARVFMFNGYTQEVLARFATWWLDACGR